MLVQLDLSISQAGKIARLLLAEIRADHKLAMKTEDRTLKSMLNNKVDQTTELYNQFARVQKTIIEASC